MTETKTAIFVSGFVSILGRPNVGKSTLMNALIGTKVAIVANKPQTTRTGIQGVLTLPSGQIVFVDTPGIHKARSSLNRRMMDSVREALDQRDLLLYVADSTAPFTTADREALDMVKKSQSLGRSGSTGLAGGDHLHFSMQVDGVQVNPIEWWDEHWIKDRILSKVRAQ